MAENIQRNAGQKSEPETPDKSTGKRRKHLRHAVMLLVALLFLLAIVYVGVQVFSVLGHNYKTETAIAFTMSDSISLQGVAVFEAEEVPGSGTLGYLVSDGERVTDGSVLAEEYTDSSQGQIREELSSLNEAIALLEKSQNSSGSDLSLLTAQTSTALYDLLDQLDVSAYSGISSVEQEFLLAQNRLQVSTGQVTNFSDALSSLQSEYDSLSAQLGELATVQADTNGYFISAANSGFLSTDSATISGASPAEFASLLNNGLEAERDGLVGRIITGFTWKFYATCTAEQAERFNGISTVKISFPGKADAPLSATVAAVEVDSENDVAKIELDCQNINAQVLGLAQETAQIDLQTYTGIRIDKSALHILNGNKGVYVKYGNLQRFRKITILYENDSYILAPEGGEVGTDNEVRLYDDVIVEGTNLRDGKLI